MVTISWDTTLGAFSSRDGGREAPRERFLLYVAYAYGNADGLGLGGGHAGCGGEVWDGEESGGRRRCGLVGSVGLK